MIRRLSMLLAAVCGVSLSLQAQRPADWTQWRGPNRDGAAPFSVPQTWPERLTQKWKLEVGNGYATPLVIGNRVYVFARQGDNEVMMALDADTGKEVWKNAGYPASVHDAERHGAARTGAEVHSRICERTAVHDRHDRRGHRMGCQHRQAGVAEAGRHRQHAAVHLARVLSGG